MKKPEVLKQGISAAFGAGLTLIISTHAMASGIQTQLDNMYSEMTNYTPPGVYESQRRGVLSGGRFTYKNKLFDESLVSLRPPSWKGGCGGIDMFGGSFSFINSDQLVQLLRSVASNAKGYAFQLAMDNVCPDCMKWMNELQTKMQKLNQYFGNSCQLAQGIVNDTVGAFDKGHKTEASITNTIDGFVDDFFGASEEPDGESSLKKLKSNDPSKYQEMIGNIVWKQLKKNAATSWFVSGDEALLEAIMSITGSAVIGDLEDDDSSSGETNPIVTLPGNKIRLTDLVYGNANTPVYDCSGDTSNCIITAATTAPQNIKGFQTLITDQLKGTGSTHGVIAKYAAGGGLGDLSDAQKGLMANLPQTLGTLVRNLAVLSPESANAFVTESSGSIALIYARTIIDEAFRASKIALSNSKSTFAPQAYKEIAESQRVVQSEYNALLSTFGPLSDKVQHYNNLIVNIRKQRYLVAELTAPPRNNQ